MDQDVLYKDQLNMYNLSWDQYSWNNEKLFPVLLPIDKILKLSTAKLNVYTAPQNLNVIGAPRSGTKWAQKMLGILAGNTIYGSEKIGHFHEGIIEDFKDKKVLFIYRDIRDCIVSGYFYIKNGLHDGTMTSTTENFKLLTQDEALKSHIIMYMKYRMPFIDYWHKVNSDNLAKIKYEDLLENRYSSIKSIKNTLGLKVNPIRMYTAYKNTAFQKMTKGRKMGHENTKSHQRKGIAGDWENHFTSEHKRIFEDMGGNDFLQSLGYTV